MTVLIPGDTHQYGFCFLITCALQLSCFAVAYTCKFDLITDFAGSMNFVLLGVITLVLGGDYDTRQVVVTAMLCVSRVELALFLFYRVCKRKSDGRFDKIRGSFLKFLGFWIFQIFWVYGVSLAVIRINSARRVDSPPPIGPADVFGWVLWVFGFVIQFTSDLQKLWFRADPANNLKICNKGMWKYSRHPNYFGEICMWGGLFITGIPIWLSDGNADGWLTVISPVLTIVILLFLSGMPTAEGQSLKRYYTNGDALKNAYEAYRAETAPVITCCPPIYKALPSPVQCVLCCEYERYAYNESKTRLSNA